MRIVLALDGSPSSLDARDLVAGIPWPENTTITLVTAFDVPADWIGDGMGGAWLTGTDDALHEPAREALVAMAAPLDDRGWTIEQRIIEGRAATAILSVADVVDADLIVVGSRGRGPFLSMMLGSVSAEVTAQARRSVLVARGKRVSRVLVATDGSECASRIPDVLAEWGVLRGLEGFALSVAPVDSPAFELMVSLYTLGDETVERQREELLVRHREYAEQMAQRLSGIGISAQPDVKTGDAAHEIVKAAVERQADLIVTGSRCLHGADRWLLGSVARNVVLHAHSSVLIIRPRGRVGRSLAQPE